jgi:multidrug resistance efflux pump
MANEEQVGAAEQQEQPADPAQDPVRRWTMIILILIGVLLVWYLRSDRVTPYTSQARVHALVVPIAAEVSGTVTAVNVGNSQPVNAGQVLFELEQNRYQLAVETAEANLKTARQGLGASAAGVDAARAGVDTAAASMLRAEQDAIRMRNIREQDPGAISQRRLESAEAGLSEARGQVAAAKANLEQAIQNLGATGEDNSHVEQAQAALDQAQLDLKHTTVRAPEPGVVTDVRINTGNFAGAGAPQMTFIAQENVWVQADFTENNLGNIDPGDEVALVFDILPGAVVEGIVREVGFGVSLESAPLGTLPSIKNDTNWLRSSQRYPVLIDFELAEEDAKRLKVGSQVSVVVYTGSHFLFNPLATLRVHLNALLTYAY